MRQVHRCAPHRGERDERNFAHVLAYDADVLIFTACHRPDLPPRAGSPFRNGREILHGTDRNSCLRDARFRRARRLEGLLRDREFASVRVVANRRSDSCSSRRVVNGSDAVHVARLPEAATSPAQRAWTAWRSALDRLLGRLASPAKEGRQACLGRSPSQTGQPCKPAKANGQACSSRSDRETESYG